jgi:hypothetical protein
MEIKLNYFLTTSNSTPNLPFINDEIIFKVFFIHAYEACLKKIIEKNQKMCFGVLRFQMVNFEISFHDEQLMEVSIQISYHYVKLMIHGHVVNKNSKTSFCFNFNGDL